MTHTPPPPPHLTDAIENARRFKLTPLERADMHRALSEYRTFHPMPELAINPRHAWLARYAAACAVVVVLVVAVPVVTSHDALPGEPLYAVKVDFVEPITGAFNTTELSQISFETSLLSRRLEEVQRLRSAGQLTIEEAAVVEREVTERIADIARVLSSDEHPAIASSSLRALSDAVSVVKVHDYIEDATIGNSVQSGIDRGEETLRVLLVEEAATYARIEVSAVEGYIEDTIDEINAVVAQEPDIASDVSQELTDYLTDIETALETNSYDVALIATLEAEQLLDAAVAIDDLEEQDEAQEVPSSDAQETVEPVE